jgi:ADP-ribose pyrophosphatase YjhB (NUDIX family)
MNKNNVCNNCGKQGHLFHQCKLPIISYGVIVFRYNYIKNNIEYLMIRRKNSFGFIDLIRGKYNLNNIEYLQNIINEMSVPEKEMIKNTDFKTLWKQMWGDIIMTNQYKYEEVISQKKFELLKNGITCDIDINLNTPTLINDINDTNIINDILLSTHTSNSNNLVITLESLIENSNTSWNETEWEFPKGRKNQSEKELDCALREFEEETGYSKNKLTIINNVLPFEEIYIGTNYKSYKHKYFLAYFDKNENNITNNNSNIISNINEKVDNNNLEIINNFQKNEVSCVEWKTLEECLESIRPYNLEKKQLITNINKVLEEYRLY